LARNTSRKSSVCSTATASAVDIACRQLALLWNWRTAQARSWVKPLLKQVRHDQVAHVMTQLQDLKPRMEAAAAQATDQAIEYYQHHQQRMNYKEARRRDEPVGSGAIESTCRQLQCRMKRCGQFWSTAGDEALLCLEMFWRNERWELLFPHAKLTAISNN
jgi:hypothetical protein